MICTGCLIDKNESEFYKHPSIGLDGIRKRCNECRRNNRNEDRTKIRKTANARRKKNRDEINKKDRITRSLNRSRFKSYALKKAFGIDIIEYNKLFELQNGLCKICNEPEKAKHQSGHIKQLAVDHDHKTGKIRGLLCWICNTGIGKLKEDPKLLRKAADYIESNR